MVCSSGFVLMVSSELHIEAGAADQPEWQSHLLPALRFKQHVVALETQQPARERRLPRRPARDVTILARRPANRR